MHRLHQVDRLERPHMLPELWLQVETPSCCDAGVDPACGIGIGACAEHERHDAMGGQADCRDRE